MHSKYVYWSSVLCVSLGACADVDSEPEDAEDVGVEVSALETWTPCAMEGATCSFSGAKVVRYGASGSYVTKIALNSIGCDNATFGDPIYGTPKSCSYTDALWTPCAVENGTCAVPANSVVRYGANGAYAYGYASSEVVCNNATFGDPIYGTFKHCDVALVKSTCQTASNEYGIDHGVTWGFAPQDVQTWWVNNNCNTSPASSNTNNAATSDQEVEYLATAFAPIVWLHGQEHNFPSSTDYFLANVHDEEHDGEHFKVTNQALGCDSCTDPPFLGGQNPLQNQVPVYAEIVKRTQNGQATNVVDVIYWMFYPYNNGKRVCIGWYSPWGCVGGYTTAGNHVGDWEHMTIRFVDGSPQTVYLSQHDGGQTINYGDPSLTRENGRVVIFAALGSHGLYPDAARHTYKNLPNGDTLDDDTSAGVRWDTSAGVVMFRPQSQPPMGTLSWLNYSGHWGNPKSGCEPLESISGECVLNNGPGSILPRPESNPENWSF